MIRIAASQRGERIQMDDGKGSGGNERRAPPCKERENPCERVTEYRTPKIEQQRGGRRKKVTKHGMATRSRARAQGPKVTNPKVSSRKV